MEIVTPIPPYNSRLVDNILELENYRGHDVNVTTPNGIFRQLKTLFHMIEALSSARIEGNHTTIAAFVLKQNESNAGQDEQVDEIINLLHAMDFIDENIVDHRINGQFIREIQDMAVHNLRREGDGNHGAWRTNEVTVGSHQPPVSGVVPAMMDELIRYANEPCSLREKLLKIAVAHHRFVWIHPFNNGNGRTARLFTYAMLRKYGYIVNESARMYNPAAVFAANRDDYYKYLSAADDLSDEHVLQWCDYFIDGLRTEVDKTKMLADKDYVNSVLIVPAIDKLHADGGISSEMRKLLTHTAKLGVVMASDLSNAVHEFDKYRISRLIADAKSRGFIEPINEGARKYSLKITGTILTVYILQNMEKAGMLPIPVNN